MSKEDIKVTSRFKRWKVKCFGQPLYPIIGDRAWYVDVFKCYLYKGSIYRVDLYREMYQTQDDPSGYKPKEQ